jgi:AraC family transcriptional activator of mtrCDE
MGVAAADAAYMRCRPSALLKIGRKGGLSMPARLRIDADRIKHPEGIATSRADPLSTIAPFFRARPEIQAVCRFGLEWEIAHPAEPEGFAQFHIVTRGSCLLERHGGETFSLKAGSVLLLPQGDSHVVRSASRGVSGTPVRTEYHNAIRIETDTSGAGATELICGRLRFEGAMAGLVTAALPKAIILGVHEKIAFDRMQMLVRAIDDELQGERPGAMAIATELATALFVMMLRIHFEQSASSSGAIRLLALPAAAKAVTAMLKAPAHPWTLDELASQAHVSRSTLVRLFRKEGDIAPLGFLSELRLGLARQRLMSTGGTVMEVASAVGYDSESAFARAFQRRFGISPGRLRGRHGGPFRGGRDDDMTGTSAVPAAGADLRPPSC